MALKRPGTARHALAWFARLVVVGAVAGVLLLPPAPTGSAGRDTAAITSYAAVMDLDGDGDLFIEERITVLMPPAKRGIFRILDTAAPRRDNVTHPVDVIAVERDGSPEPWTVVPSAPGTTSIRIGEESVFLPAGEHDYRIRSSTTDVLEPGDDGETLWWWDVVGSGWQMPMATVDISVALPATPLRTECVQGDDTPCTAAVEGTSLRVRTGPLEPFTPVTVRVAFDDADVATPIEGGAAVATIVGSIVAALAAAALAAALLRATRERTPGLPVLFEPPFMIPPALGVKVLDEDHSGDDLQATLFDLAERGLLRLEGDDRDRWHLHVVADTTERDLHPVERTLLNRLGLVHPGDTFTVSKSTASGEVVAEARKALRAQVAASSRQYLDPSTAGLIATGLGWLSLAGVVVMAGVYFFGGSGTIIWPLFAAAAGFAVVSAGMALDNGVRTVRNEKGRDLWSRVGGFARFLTTDSSESRFDAAAHMDWYPRYLAWAVALGSADRWAEKYEAQGVEVPQVPWLLWVGTGPMRLSPTRMSSSFNSTIASASAAYAASQAAKAASSGGGFSGGSGGGGGGGGSW